MHWMNDWGTPSTLFVTSANGVILLALTTLITPIFVWVIRARSLAIATRLGTCHHYNTRKKVLVFDGCYYGTVDDTMLNMIDGKVIYRQSLLAQTQDLTLHSVAVPFNDLAAIER